MCVLSLVMGKGQKLIPELLQAFAIGAFLHDVGQMRIPRNIPPKTDLYTPQERKLMQKYSELGTAMLRRSGMSEDLCPVVLEHHEQPDGSGSQQRETISHLILAGRSESKAKWGTARLFESGCRVIERHPRTVRLGARHFLVSSV